MARLKLLARLRIQGYSSNSTPSKHLPIVYQTKLHSQLQSIMSSFTGLSLVASLVYTILVRAPPSLTRTISKTAATALLSVHTLRSNGPVTLTAALGLGSLGDAFLSYTGEKAFLRGLASFLVAHLFYISLFVQSGSRFKKIFSQTWRIAALVVMLLLAPIMNSLLMPNVSPTLQIPIQLYSATIFAMVVSVLTMENATIVLGGLIFAISDAILSTDEFLVPSGSSHRVWMQYSVWFLYYGGQYLIAKGFGEQIIR